MKYTIATIAVLVAGAIAAPTAAMIDQRQMNAVHVLYDNKEALMLTPEEMNAFDKFMSSMHKRDAEASGAPMNPSAGSSTSGAPTAAATSGAVAAAPTGGNPVGNLTGAVGGAVGGDKGGPVGGVTSALGGLTGGKAGGMGGDMKKGGLLGGAIIPGIV